MPIKVAIIDDDQSARKSLARLMKSAGISAVTFSSAQEFLEAAKDSQVDCAVTDLQMPVDDEVLLDAVRRAAERSREARASRAEFDDLQRRYERLTPRERQVFQLITSGLLNKQAGAELGTGEKTIKVQRARVMDKMEAASLAELVRMADQLHIQPAAKTDSKPRRSGDARPR